eukprot:TRINITY_DN7121_c0_g1_i1.p1 TRINITY_DN7121_c0_g1~~TRINITY_DN7121_c0_g1_i1.p1  ORF type:complete len:333 (+),score=87.32 TRINITY_DN7121_c0_g1_i1:201-1199(+)
MGCGGSKDSAPAPVAAKKEVSPALKKQCSEIVEKLDANSNGQMEYEEIQVLVKNMHPRFAEIKSTDITPKDPEMAALDGMTKTKLIEHLATTMDEGWVQAFHQFLGLSGDHDKALATKSFEPGVYKVTWDGGVRFRNSNVYVDVWDEKDDSGKVPMAQVGQTYRIRFFVKGVMGQEGQTRATEVWYGYLEWARRFIPMSFPDGRETMERVSEYDNAEQLERMAASIYDRMAGVSQSSDGVTPEVLLAYLDGAKIGYDHSKLASQLAAADANSDQLVQKEEFVNCFTQHGSISDCLWVDTHGNNTKPHHENVAALFAVESPHVIVPPSFTEQM